MSAVAEPQTPALIVDLDRLERNVAEMAALVARRGVRFLPHVKTHKCSRIAQLQLSRGGAIGLTCQTLGEAETMAALAPPELLIPYELVGPAKLARAAALARRVPLSTVVDSQAAATALAAAAEAAGARIDVLIEIACGYRRCGTDRDGALALAAHVAERLPQLRVAGILTYEGHLYDLAGAEAVAAAASTTYDMLGEVATALRAAGHDVGRVSVGASAAAETAAAHPAVTELRCGSYAFGDRSQVAMGWGALDRCALTVRGTVVSTPARDRIVLDTGSKALSFAELPGHPGYGTIVERPEAVIGRLSDEHAMVEVADAASFAIGEQLHVVPNAHALAVNQFDELHAVRAGRPAARWPIDGRSRLPREWSETTQSPTESETR